MAAGSGGLRGVWALLTAGPGTRETADAPAVALDSAENARGAAHEASLEFAIDDLGNTAVFTGQMSGEWRDGAGRVTTSTVTVDAVWSRGVPTGPITWTCTDSEAEESAIASVTCEGVTPDGLCGAATEVDDDGDVRFTGGYAAGARHCDHGVETLPCGSQLSGRWVQGVFCGPDNRYIYPGERTWLQGTWDAEGQMLAAQAYFSDDGNRDVVPHPDVPRGHVFSLDQSDAAEPSSAPTVGDPHERSCTYPAASELPNSGTGLFARVALPAGMVVAYYNGVRLPVEVANERSWDENAYTISLYSGEHETDDDGMALDLPSAHLPRYCATFGHLVNHADPPHTNVEFEYCVHPRFGEIKCLRTLVDIAQGSELYADYGYGEFRERTPPPWFEERATLK